MSQNRRNIRFDQPVEAAPTATMPQPVAPEHPNGNSAPVATPVAPPAPVPAPPALQLGRGLDVGTANLLSAVTSAEGNTIVKRERNAFLEIPATASGNRDMLTKLGVPYVQHRDKLFVLGDMSFDLANMFGTEVRRPMQDGFLSPAERDAIPIMRFILERLLGPPAAGRASRCTSAFLRSPSTRTTTSVYHEGIVGGILRKLGYTPNSINEGHAVVYSELGDQRVHGDRCLVRRRHVQRVRGLQDDPRGHVLGGARRRLDRQPRREGHGHPAHAGHGHQGGRRQPARRRSSREEEAVVLYYRNLISYVLLQPEAALRTRPRHSLSSPSAVEVVVSGGTSMVGGFVEVFAQELQKIDFPLRIAGVRGAEDPLSSVVRGSLIAAALSDES